MNWMTKIYLRMISYRPDEDEGATMVEYGLMVSLVAAVVAVAAATLGTEIANLFNGLLPFV